TLAAASAASSTRSPSDAAVAKAPAVGPNAARTRPARPPGTNRPQLSISIDRARIATPNMASTIQIDAAPSTGVSVPTMKNAATLNSDNASADAFHDGTNDSSAVDESTTRTCRSGRVEGGNDTDSDDSSGVQPYNPPQPWFKRVPGSVLMKLKLLWVRAAWARSIALAIPASIGAWRSRACPQHLPRTLNGSLGSSVKRNYSPR